MTEPRTAAGCPACEQTLHAYNTAVANGLVIKARGIARRLEAHQSIHPPAGLDYEWVPIGWEGKREKWGWRKRAPLASDAGSGGALDVERLADAIRAAHPNLRTFDNCGNAGKSGGCLGHDTSNEDATAIAAAYAAAGEGATFDEAGSVGGVSADTVLVGAEGPALASGTRALRLAAPFVTLVVARWDEGTGLWASTPLHAEGLKAERIIAAAYDAEQQGEQA